ncbi:hypothetical protein PROFUN_13234 [Planoprotostelium fungivorum]|uniref:Uncharacterized protein n=1 Tax=Planoprotostelium fungivorum TaxID=1890364 RepID=A0A2P6N4Q8_9EUKA|nr:hypothetical protein PROFUN_13234 [Planoprotostelium fungivorum]
MPFQRSLELGSFSHGEEELSSQSIMSLTESWTLKLLESSAVSSYILETGQLTGQRAEATELTATTYTGFTSNSKPHRKPIAQPHHQTNMTRAVRSSSISKFDNHHMESFDQRVKRSKSVTKMVKFSKLLSHKASLELAMTHVFPHPPMVEEEEDDDTEHIILINRTGSKMILKRSPQVTRREAFRMA